MQGSTADLVRLVDLSASAHQGHSALIPPVSSRIVQWCPAPTSKATRVMGKINSTLDNQTNSSKKTPGGAKWRLTFPLCPSYSDQYHYLRASSDIQHFCQKR